MIYSVLSFRSNKMCGFYKISHTELDVFFGNFILSVRKKGGEEFEPVSLGSMVFSIDRSLRRHRSEASIMQSPEKIFTSNQTNSESQTKGS